MTRSSYFAISSLIQCFVLNQTNTPKVPHAMEDGGLDNRCLRHVD